MVMVVHSLHYLLNCRDVNHQYNGSETKIAEGERHG
jgi:hypothetical protein